MGVEPLGPVISVYMDDCHLFITNGDDGPHLGSECSCKLGCQIFRYHFRAANVRCAGPLPACYKVAVILGSKPNIRALREAHFRNGHFLKTWSYEKYCILQLPVSRYSSKEQTCCMISSEVTFRVPAREYPGHGRGISPGFGPQQVVGIFTFTLRWRVYLEASSLGHI